MDNANHIVNITEKHDHEQTSKDAHDNHNENDDNDNDNDISKPPNDAPEKKFNNGYNERVETFLRSLMTTLAKKQKIQDLAALENQTYNVLFQVFLALCQCVTLILTNIVSGSNNTNNQMDNITLAARIFSVIMTFLIFVQNTLKFQFNAEKHRQAKDNYIKLLRYAQTVTMYPVDERVPGRVVLNYITSNMEKIEAKTPSVSRRVRSKVKEEDTLPLLGFNAQNYQPDALQSNQNDIELTNLPLNTVENNEENIRLQDLYLQRFFEPAAPSKKTWGLF